MSLHALSKCWSVEARIARAQSLSCPRKCLTTISQSTEWGSSTSLGTPSSSRPDPYKVLSAELAGLRTSLLTLLRSGNPALNKITEYSFYILQNMSARLWFFARSYPGLRMVSVHSGTKSGGSRVTNELAAGGRTERLEAKLAKEYVGF